MGLTRFMDGRADVFTEVDHYLYAETGPGAWGYGYQVNEYHVLPKFHNVMPAPDSNPMEWEWTRHDMRDADGAYLSALDYAPDDIARAIITIENRRAAYWAALCEGLEGDDLTDGTEMYMTYLSDMLDTEFGKLTH